jgi:PAS domain S-box-containing protein
MAKKLKNNITPRKRSEKARDRSLHFEKLISKISAIFINLPPSEVDRNINDGLQIVSKIIDVDEIFILQFQGGQGKAGLTHGWFKNGKVRELKFNASEFIHVFPWAGRKILENEVIIFEKMDELPAEARNEREYIKKIGLESAVVMPLFTGKKNIGAFFIQTLRREKKWSREMVNQLRLIGDIFANALDRKNIDNKLAESEQRLHAFMYHSPAFMYIKDRSGKHLYANRALLEYFKISLDKFIGTTTYDYLPEKVARMIEENDREVIEKGCPIETDDINVAIPGKTLHIREIKFPITLYSGDTGVGGIVIDITSLKEKEANLQKAYDEIKRLKDNLERENIYLRHELKLESNFEEIIGQSDALKYVLFKVAQVGPTDSTVLILGETGTGKGLVARAIHEISPRKNRVMVTVNCAALPANLIESELFGREKGAFTGALNQQIGRFEFADGGTVFLDEIGELPLELQSKLLRVIEEGKFERLGSPKTVKVDVRIIASTNRVLSEEIRNGRFREDLFYRLNIFPITIPPLRNRIKDIPILVHHFLNSLSKKVGKEIREIPKTVMRELEAYHWPGNVRELQHVIERAVITAHGSVLCLAEKIEAPNSPRSSNTPKPGLVDMERDYILKSLEESNWKVEGQHGAAESLGVNPSTLRTKMRKLGIKRPRKWN